MIEIFRSLTDLEIYIVSMFTIVGFFCSVGVILWIIESNIINYQERKKEKLIEEMRDELIIFFDELLEVENEKA